MRPLTHTTDENRESITLRKHPIYHLTTLPTWMRRAPTLARMKQADAMTSINHVSGSLPEITYCGFSAYGFIFPFFLRRYHKLNLHQLAAVDFSWNILDGTASIILGLTQLLDKKTHRPLVQRVKGSINLSMGIQLIVFTALASPAAPIVFIAASFVDLILSLEPLIHHYSRWISFNYWLKDSLAQLDKLQRDMLDLQEEQIAFDQYCTRVLKNRPLFRPAAESEVHEEEAACKTTVHTQVHEDLHTTSTKQASAIALEKKSYQAMRDDLDWIAEQKQERMIKLITDIQALSGLIMMRLYHHQANLDQAVKDQIEKNTSMQNALIRTSLASTFNLPDTSQQKIPQPSIEEITSIEGAISKQLRNDFRDAAIETMIFALAVSGWTLLLVPGLQLPTIIFILLAISCYAMKNIYKIYHCAHQQQKEEYTSDFSLSVRASH